MGELFPEELEAIEAYLDPGHEDEHEQGAAAPSEHDAFARVPSHLARELDS